MAWRLVNVYSNFLPEYSGEDKLELRAYGLHASCLERLWKITTFCPASGYAIAINQSSKQNSVTLDREVSPNQEYKNKAGRELKIIVEMALQLRLIKMPVLSRNST